MTPRVYWEKKGDHVHMVVYVGQSGHGAYAGYIVVRADEFDAFRESWPAAQFKGGTP